jgi:hypothetical protein
LIARGSRDALLTRFGIFGWGLSRIDADGSMMALLHRRRTDRNETLFEETYDMRERERARRNGTYRPYEEVCI